MLLAHPNIRIWLYNAPTDMRKQFDGLAALAKNQIQAPIDEHHLFVFINRKRTQIKLLYYNTGGLCLWTKRLERGQFQRLAPTEPHTHQHPLDWTALQCLIDGVNWLKAPRLKRFQRPNAV
jgi:transposase